MSYAPIITAIDDHYVGTITLNRPDQLNTFNSEMAEGLYHALTGMDSNEKIRVIMIKGSGKAFCAGIDVNELEGKTTIEYRSWIEHMERPLVTISRMKKR